MEKMQEFFDYYSREMKQDSIPSGNEYDFLLERNKNHMNNVALSFDNKKITYEELHERIDEYSRALYKKGIRRGTKVGVIVVNTPESVCLLYALKKLEAQVIGLSPLNTEYKMRRDIELTRPEYIISVDMMYSKFKNAAKSLEITPVLYSPLESIDNKGVKFVYDAKQLFTGNKILNPDNNLMHIVNDGKNNEEVEYPTHINGTTTDIMFTGGSNGVHKGVDLDGNGLNSVVKALDYVLVLEPGMTHLGNIPFGHMCFGRLVLHYVLCKNMEYALTLKAMPKDFYDELVRTGAHGAMGGPVHWEILSMNKNLKEGSLSNLIQPLSGGEMFKPQKLIEANEALRKAGCNTPIGNGLGLTEMWAPTHVCVGNKNTQGTIGYPIPFVNSKIADPKTFKELPNETPGVLLVNGPGMMLGYHDNKEETDEVFVYDEFGVKWYNTKDVLVKHENGEYEFVGRVKRNFVSGVDNIYPEQIEALLLKIPEIREVVVTAIADDKEQFLPSYHISLNDFDCDKKTLENKIFNLIKKTYGESALPGYIEYYAENLPRTDNGKLNVKVMEEKDKEKIKENTLVRTRLR